MFAQRVLAAPFVEDDSVIVAADLPGGVSSQQELLATDITEGGIVTTLPDFDFDTPDTGCDAVSYEAESMYHSTGGPAVDGWNIWTNGYIATDHDFAEGPAVIRVRARGQSALGVWPHMIVRVAGAVVGAVTVNSSEWLDYPFTLAAAGGVQEVAVEFTNDYYAPPADRNLFVDRIVIECDDP